MTRTLILLAFAPCVLLAQKDPAPEKLSAAEVETLAAREGDTLTVTGFVERTGKAASGINFLNFKDSTFVCVTFAQHVAKFEDGAPADVFEGKWVEVQGKIEIFKGKPQIRLESPSQIKVVEPPEAEPKKSAAAEPIPDPEPERQPSPIPAPLKKVAAATGPELVNGEPPVDWRTYFSE